MLDELRRSQPRDTSAVRAVCAPYLRAAQPKLGKGEVSPDPMHYGRLVLVQRAYLRALQEDVHPLAAALDAWLDRPHWAPMNAPLKGAE